jgi:hypothetical protein
MSPTGVLSTPGTPTLPPYLKVQLVCSSSCLPADLDEVPSLAGPSHADPSVDLQRSRSGVTDDLSTTAEGLERLRSCPGSWRDPDGLLSSEGCQTP